MNAPRKLPAEVVDQVLRRMVATYGRRFWLQYEGAEASDVRAIWSRELGGYAERAAAIAWAFENLPEDPPNAIAFRNLCRRAPIAQPEQLPEPPADPQRVAAELAKLKRLTCEQHNADGLNWARRLIARHEAGEHVGSAALRDARKALARRNVAGPVET